MSARIYPYEGEAVCDLNTTVTLRSIDVAAQQKGGFAAIKLSSLGRPQLLMHLTDALNAVRRLFYRFDNLRPEDVRSYSYYVDRQLSETQFYEGLARLGVSMTPSDMTSLFRKIDQDGNGNINYLEWLEALDPSDRTTRPFFTKGFASDGGALDPLTPQQEQGMTNMLGRLERLVSAASEKRVRLMIDAEQTYMQPAIDHMALLLQRKYNRDFPVIYNTYQCYLVSTRARVHLHMQIARQRRHIFACKLVRGAYMVQERLRATQHGYRDPILPTKADTDRNYNEIAGMILRDDPTASMIIATHNEASVRHVVDLMQELGIQPASGRVFFGQLVRRSTGAAAWTTNGRVAGVACPRSWACVTMFRTASD